MGDMGSMCCCVGIGPWFDLMIFTAGATAGNRDGYFGGPEGVLAGVRKTGSTTVPYGFTDDGLNTSGSFLAFPRLSTEDTASVKNSWQDGTPPYRFDLHDVLVDLVDAADAYAGPSGTDYKCAWIVAMFDRNGSGSWAIVEGDVATTNGGTTLGGNRQVWCSLDASGDVTETLETYKAVEYTAWTGAGNNPNRPDRPWRGFDHYDAGLAWSATVLAQYDGETVTTYTGDAYSYSRRIETATRSVTYGSGAGDEYIIPGVDRYERSATTTGTNPVFEDVITAAILDENTGPGSTTAYTGDGGVYLWVETPSAYYPRGFVHSLNEPTADYIDDAYIPGTIVEAPFITFHTRYSLITQTTSVGFGYRTTPGRNAVLETELNETITTVTVSTHGGTVTTIHNVDGSPVANQAAAEAACPSGVDTYQGTDSTDFAIYADGGRRSVAITDHTTLPNIYTGQQVDDVELTHTWESGEWKLRLNADEVAIERDDTLGTLYHLAPFGDFTSGGSKIFDLLVTTVDGRPLRTLDLSAFGYPINNYAYQPLTADSFHIFPGDPLTGEASMLVAYLWDGAGFYGYDLLFMGGPDPTVSGTIKAVLRHYALKVGPGPYPSLLTIHGTTAQGVYFNNFFAFRDGKGTIPNTGVDPDLDVFVRHPIHPANGADAAGTSFDEERETIAVQHLIRYGETAGQTYIDKSFATDTTSDWIGM